MSIIQSRRGFITGLVSLLAAPAIVRAGSLMPVKSIILEVQKVIELVPMPTLHVGDIITFDGIFSFNRVAKKMTDRLQSFVVTANCDGKRLSVYSYINGIHNAIMLDDDIKDKITKINSYAELDKNWKEE